MIFESLRTHKKKGIAAQSLRLPLLKACINVHMIQIVPLLPPLDTTFSH